MIDNGNCLVDDVELVYPPKTRASASARATLRCTLISEKNARARSHSRASLGVNQFDVVYKAIAVVDHVTNDVT